MAGKKGVSGRNDKTHLKPKFLEVLPKHDGFLGTAAKSIGLSINTVMNWRRRDPEFNARVEEVLDLQTEFVQSCMMKRVREGDVGAMKYTLETRYYRMTEREAKRADQESEREARREDGRQLANDIVLRITEKFKSDSGHE